jgi:hypothetical protein
MLMEKAAVTLEDVKKSLKNIRQRYAGNTG